METTSVRCLINSISRFIHLVSCQTIKPLPIQKEYTDVVGLLKLLKPVLDDVVDYKIPSDEFLFRECEALDVLVNEAREFLENWGPKMSRICAVLRSEPLLMQIESSLQAVCRMISKLSQTSSSSSKQTALQQCMQSLQSLKQERISRYIEEALKSQKDDISPCNEHLIRITESLGLNSNQELLKESVAVEKERMKAEENEAKKELQLMNQIVDLVSYIRDWMVKTERVEGINGVSIPSYFRCPLSWELMLDPVIVASGQTYDRGSIQKWLDHGLIICPKTRRVLSHTNLIPNYTVKAMIANWCEENELTISNKFRHNLSSLSSSPSGHVAKYSNARSFPEVGNGSEKQKEDISSQSNGGRSNGCKSSETEKSDHSYIYRSGSASSAMSTIDHILLGLNESVDELSGEITSKFPNTSPNKESPYSFGLAEQHLQSIKTNVDVKENETCKQVRDQALLNSDSGSNTSIPNSHIKKLVEDLKSQRDDLKTKAAEELRLLAKDNKENRVIIGNCGAISSLMSLLYSEEELTQEHSVTALLNLSIDDNIKARIAEAGAIKPLIHVLKTGNDVAKENSAASLFSLSLLEEYKAKIGRSGAIIALVDLLASGTLRGKKDAATALFNLSIFHENKVRIVQAGAVKYLIELLDPSTGMTDKAAALLANLSTVGEGRLALVKQGGIPLLVEMVESGSQRGKENAASILLQLCLNSSKFCTLVLQEGAVPPLVSLSQCGTTRAKEKAQQLLSHFRNQREAGVRKLKT